MASRSLAPWTRQGAGSSDPGRPSIDVAADRGFCGASGRLPPPAPESEGNPWDAL